MSSQEPLTCRCLACEQRMPVGQPHRPEECIAALVKQLGERDDLLRECSDRIQRVANTPEEDDLLERIDAVMTNELQVTP